MNTPERRCPSLLKRKRHREACTTASSVVLSNNGWLRAMDITQHCFSDIVEAAENDPTILRRTISTKRPPSTADPADDVTVVWQCASLGNAKLLQALLGIVECREGIGVTVQEVIHFQRARDGVSCLYIASQNGHIACVDILLQHGASVDQPRNTGATPLFIATQKNEFAIAMSLLDHGASLESENDQHCTPLVLACSMGLVELAQAYLDRGANAMHSRTGLSPAGWAERRGHGELKVVAMRGVASQLGKKCSLQHLQGRYRAWLAFVACRTEERQQQTARNARVARLDTALQMMVSQTHTCWMRAAWTAWVRHTASRCTLTMVREATVMALLLRSRCALGKRFWETWERLVWKARRDKIWILSGGPIPELDALANGLMVPYCRFRVGSRLDRYEMTQAAPSRGVGAPTHSLKTPVVNYQSEETLMHSSSSETADLVAYYKATINMLRGGGGE